MALLIKNLNGLAYASVKNRNGLAVASIKNINGLDATGATPTILYTDTGADGTDASSYTFTARAIGSAGADRKVIVAVWARTTGGTTLAASGVTVGGVTATLVTGTNRTGVNATVSNYSGIWIADVPTGTTGDVVVTTNIGASRCVVAVYKATGITGTPYAVATDYSSTSSVGGTTLNCNTTATSVGIGIGGWASNFAATWTGLTEDIDANIETSNYSAASFTFSSVQTPRTISIAPGSASTDRIGSCAVFN